MSRIGGLHLKSARTTAAVPYLRFPYLNVPLLQALQNLVVDPRKNAFFGCPFQDNKPEVRLQNSAPWHAAMSIYRGVQNVLSRSYPPDRTHLRLLRHPKRRRRPSDRFSERRYSIKARCRALPRACRHARSAPRLPLEVCFRRRSAGAINRVTVGSSPPLCPRLTWQRIWDNLWQLSELLSDEDLSAFRCKSAERCRYVSRPNSNMPNPASGIQAQDLQEGVDAIEGAFCPSICVKDSIFCPFQRLPDPLGEAARQECRRHSLRPDIQP